MSRVAALEEHNEEVEKAINHSNCENGVEDMLLPFFGQDSQEEQTERDFQKSCCEKIEDF